MFTAPDRLDLLTDLIAKARRAGADAADAVWVEGVSLSFSRRLGKQERLERSESADLGLRVLIGRRQAMVSSSDTGAEALDELVARGVAMARAVPEDPWCGLALPEQLAAQVPDLDAFDPVEPTPEVLEDRAARAEDAALAVPGVTNSEGASAGWGRSTFAIAASNGFARVHSGSRHSVSVSVLAGEGTAMQTDYDYTSVVHGADLRNPEDIGRAAGEKAVRRLHPRKAESARLPVVFDPRVARSLLGHLAGAANGASVARGTSFLKDRMGQRIFREGVTVIDDPHRRRGLASRPFDGEGIATRRRAVVEDGVLSTWFLDLATARQLGLETTGHAGRGTSSPPSPSPSNLYLEPGSLSPAELMADIDAGLYVTDMMGFGINFVTGDYSRGATGFWIEKGKLAYPVSEVTVAGNLIDMFARLTPAGDLEFRYGTDSPTVRVDGMTLAGR
ncbi:MAG: TldD/PmbA family protein [Magnetospirillum sp. WYHS-4]